MNFNKIEAPLSKHQLRSLIVEGKKSPDKSELRSWLINELWDKEQFKDICDLLPLITLEKFESTLALHCQVLIRVALSEKNQLKKLIPLLLNYFHFLSNEQQDAIMSLVLPLMENDKNLKIYFDKMKNISFELSKLIKIKSLDDDKLIPILPELAFKLGINSKICQLLEENQSDLAHYYRNGGHYLLLVESGFFSEYDNLHPSISITPSLNLLIYIERYKHLSVIEFISKINNFYSDLLCNSDLLIKVSTFLSNRLHSYIKVNFKINDGIEDSLYIESKILPSFYQDLKHTLNFINKLLEEELDPNANIQISALKYGIELYGGITLYFNHYKPEYSCKILFEFITNFRERPLFLFGTNEAQLFPISLQIFLELVCKNKFIDQLELFLSPHLEQSKIFKKYFLDYVDDCIKNMAKTPMLFAEDQKSVLTIKAGLKHLTKQSSRLKKIEEIEKEFI